MAILKSLAMVFAIVLAAVILDCGFLFHQASTGRKLPFKLGLFPRVGDNLQ
jgi:hypothetical protein